MRGLDTRALQDSGFVIVRGSLDRDIEVLVDAKEVIETAHQTAGGVGCSAIDKAAGREKLVAGPARAHGCEIPRRLRFLNVAYADVVAVIQRYGDDYSFN